MKWIMMAQTVFHLFSKKERKKPEQQDQQKRPLNWFLFFWLGFIYVQYMLPRIATPLQTGDEKSSSVPGGSVSSVEAFFPNESGSAILLALCVFTLFMALHSGLHWSVLFKKSKWRSLWFYFLLQIVCIWLIYFVMDG